MSEPHVEQVTVNRGDLAAILARMPHDGEEWERLAGQMLSSSRALPDGTSLCSLPWRTGTHNDRTIYAVTGAGNHYSDMFIGTLDTAELVTEAVRAHNAAIEREECQ